MAAVIVAPNSLKATRRRHRRRCCRPAFATCQSVEPRDELLSAICVPYHKQAAVPHR